MRYSNNIANQRGLQTNRYSTVFRSTNPHREFKCTRREFEDKLNGRIQIKWEDPNLSHFIYI